MAKKEGAEQKANLYLLAIVAIVAVVGIVVLVLNSGTGLTYVSESNLSGQAVASSYSATSAGVKPGGGGNIEEVKGSGSPCSGCTPACASNAYCDCNTCKLSK